MLDFTLTARVDCGEVQSGREICAGTTTTGSAERLVRQIYLSERRVLPVKDFEFSSNAFEFIQLKGLIGLEPIVEVDRFDCLRPTDIVVTR